MSSLFCFQIEGAWNRDGKIFDGKNGDIATNAYDLYQGDVNNIADLGLDVYRFSIAWSRILPSGQLKDGVNQAGIDYYNNFINALIAKGIDPCVTTFHWDVPQALQSLYGGFLSPRIVINYRNYVDILFKNFGDRVKFWITLNEPLSLSESGHTLPYLAPGRCTIWGNVDCTGGDEGIEPYLVTHHQLLSHAAAVDLYRQKYQELQGGIIGITLNSQWFLPFRDGNEDDLKAAEIQLDFTFGWFMRPVTLGDYPDTMKERVGERLPSFTPVESRKLEGSYDFLGLNYYTGSFTHFLDEGYVPPHPSYVTDSGVNVTETDSEGNPFGLGPAGVFWLQVYPRGIRDLLNYTKVVYDNPTIYITENGVCTNDTLTKEESINDTIRIDYTEDHLCCILQAIE
ncbi:beta-glucosidase 24-like [Coffea eugenioides]|uniref:beta-glucosidase 24-like n=1 Tax=Coffea eugenioides TaxID=49369 RepID=UPI000F604C68|nr:beta-glucosidase 24-like [Coffea eugenioides]